MATGFLNLEQRLSSPTIEAMKKVGSNVVNKAVLPYWCIASDVALLPVDGWRYITNGKTPVQNELAAMKVASRSVGLGELVAIAYGARAGASILQHISQNDAFQATVGSFVGSELTTAAITFSVYLGLTAINKLRHNDAGVVPALRAAFADSRKVTGISFRKGVLAFGMVDIPVSLAASLWLSPENAANLGAGLGALVYAHTTMAALDASIKDGYIGK